MDVLTMGILEELVSLDPAGDGALFATFVESFDHDSEERIAGLRAALAAKNTAALRAEAHALRGVAGTLGASRVQALATRLEDLAAGRESGDARSLVDALEAERAAALGALEAFARDVALRSRAR